MTTATDIDLDLAIDKMTAPDLGLSDRQAQRDANRLLRYQARADAHRDMALDGLGRYAVLQGGKTIFMTDDIDLASAAGFRFCL